MSPAAGPSVPTTVAPSPYNSSYPPTAGGVVQGYATPPAQAAQAVGTVVPASPAVAPPPYGAASTGGVVQGHVAQPPPYSTASTPPPQAVQVEVVAAAPMDRK